MEGSAKQRLFAYFDLVLDPAKPIFEDGCPFLNLGMEADDMDQGDPRESQKMVETELKTEIERNGV